MKKETLEQAAQDGLLEFMNTGTPDTDEYWSLFKVKNDVNDALVRAVEYGYKKGHIAGASWREQQDQKNNQLDFVVSEIAGIKLIPSIWINNPCAVVSPQASSLLVKLNASYHESTKLLAEKDAEIKMLRDLSVKSCVCLKLSDELFKAKELIKEMQDALKFYATESNWRDIVAEEAINDRHGLSEGCFDSIIYEDCENDIGGKLARKTLKENAEKIKALLGEE